MPIECLANCCCLPCVLPCCGGEGIFCCTFPTPDCCLLHPCLPCITCLVWSHEKQGQPQENAWRNNKYLPLDLELEVSSTTEKEEWLFKYARLFVYFSFQINSVIACPCSFHPFFIPKLFIEMVLTLHGTGWLCVMRWFCSTGFPLKFLRNTMVEDRTPFRILKIQPFQAHSLRSSRHIVSSWWRPARRPVEADHDVRMKRNHTVIKYNMMDITSKEGEKGEVRKRSNLD